MTLPRLRARLSSPRVVLVSVLLAVLVGVPSLWQGLQADDFYHRGLFVPDERLAPFTQPASAMFTFYDGDPARTHRIVEAGLATWWTDPEIRIAFFRPFSVATHWVDWRLWPERPFFMHLQNLLWYALLAGAVALLYRRWLAATPVVAGLAALLYAVDHTHGAPVAWIANRNALCASAVAVLALLAHERRRPLLTALLLAVGLLFGETALGALGYLAADALLGDRERRWRALLPSVVVAAAWALAYRAGGYGAHASSLYVDPAGQPLEFLTGVAVHGPLLLATELGSATPDMWLFGSTEVRAGLLLSAWLVLALGAVVLTPLLRRDPLARRLLLGSALAVIPVCATAPNARLLLLPGLGLIALVARIAVDVLDRAPWTLGWRRAAVGLAVLAGGGHVFVSPLFFQVTMQETPMFQRVIDRFADSLPEDGLAARRLIAVNSPDATFLGYTTYTRIAEGRAVPRGLLSLAVGTRPSQLERIDDRTLDVTAPGGFYQDVSDFLTAPRSRRMPVGTRVELSDVSVEVLAADAADRPTRVRFRFAAPLEDSRWLWMRWDGRRLQPRAPPAMGITEAVPAERHSL